MASRTCDTKPEKHNLSQVEFDALIEDLTNLWHYDVLTDAQYDQAVSRLENMYTGERRNR